MCRICGYTYCHPKCPNYVQEKCPYYCSICNQAIQTGEEYIENELGLKISFARKEFTVVKATEEEKNLLDMHEYDLLVCVKSYTYLEDASLFQYTISKHRPDKFRFVDFARRTQL